MRKNEPDFPSFLAAAMKAARIRSAADLARESGFSESMVSRWLRGVNQPDIENLRKIAPVLKVPVLQLVVAAGHLSPEEAKIRDLPAPRAQPIDLVTAIREEERLLPEAREHLERQFGLLLRIGGDPTVSTDDMPDVPPPLPLRRVARKRNDPKRPT